MEASTVSAYQNVARLVEPAHRLTEQQFREFWEQGVLGPFASDAAGLGEVPAFFARMAQQCASAGRPATTNGSTVVSSSEHMINVHDPHRMAPEILQICTLSSAANRAAQLLGRTSVALLHSRYRVKFPRTADDVPWHQDIGEKVSGFRADGSPVPSITVWLSLDGATRENGALQVIPGTHTQLWGDWRSGFNSRLEEYGLMNEVDITQAVPIIARPGEFYLFHSWTLHRSTSNNSDAPRSGLLMRYVDPADVAPDRTDYTLVAAS